MPGDAGPAARGPYSVSALDRYLECPFKYFAQHVLRLEPHEEEEGAFTPRRRGVFVHRVLEAFFRAWQAAGEGAVTLGNVERALDRFGAVAEAEIARLAPAERAVARAWLLGSAVAPGLAERLFLAEVEHPADLVERRLEVRLDGAHDLPAAPGVSATPGSRMEVRLDGAHDLPAAPGVSASPGSHREVRLDGAHDLPAAPGVSASPGSHREVRLDGAHDLPVAPGVSASPGSHREVRLDGAHDLPAGAAGGGAGPRRVALRGTADRIDLYADRTFRVIDYKAERPPPAVRSLQLPLYAACAERRLGGEGRGGWRAAGATYVAFGDPRLEVAAPGGDIREAMRSGERRAAGVVAAIERGAFPVRPADASRCRFCPFPTVCRKDDAGAT